MMRSFFVGITLLSGISAFAQQTMSLRQCIDYALSRNVQIKLQELNNRTEALNVSAAKNERLPEVGATANQSFNFGRGLTSSNTYVSQNTRSTSFGVSASVPIFTGFRLVNPRKQAELNLSAAVADLERLRESLSIQVTQAYLQVLYQKELVKTAQDQLALSNVQLERVKAFYENKKASGLEVTQAQNAVAQDELQLVENQNAYRLALLDLSQLIEMPSPDSLNVTVPPLQIPQRPSDGPQQIFDEAVAAKPEIVAQQFRIQSAEKGIEIARAGYWPTLNLSGNLGSSYYKVNGLSGTSFSKQMRDNFSKSIGLSLNIPIFDHFTTRTNIRRAKLNYETQQEQLQNTRKALYKEIQTAWYNAVASAKKFEASISAEKTAHEAFDLMTKKYEYGKANATEFDETKTKYLNAVSNRLSAQYDYLFRTKIIDYYRGKTIE